MQALESENENMKVFDLVSSFGIDKSLKETAESLKILSETKIKEHLKHYLD